MESIKTCCYEILFFAFMSEQRLYNTKNVSVSPTAEKLSKARNLSEESIKLSQNYAILVFTVLNI